MRCTCGNRLLAVLGEETIRTLDGTTVVFRRRTDYLLCRACLKLYSIYTLRGKADDAEPQIDEERRLPGSGPLVVGDDEEVEGAPFSVDLDDAQVEVVELSQLTEEEKAQLASLTRYSIPEVIPEGDAEPVPLEDQFEQ
ncbi:MAG: hypothetical protein ACRD1T_19210 [Acidimicrobiia bacterium]